MLSDVAAKPETIFHELYGWAKLAYTHFPAVILVLVSCLLVSVACCLFLICQFEYNKKKYVSWKSQPSSGYSTPTDLLLNNAAATAGSSNGNGGTATLPHTGSRGCLNAGKTYVALEDIDTAVSSIEDVGPTLFDRKAKAERKKQLRFCFKARQAEIARSATTGRRRATADEGATFEEGENRFRSLPSSPFQTRKSSPMSPTAAKPKPVTAAQVKKALAAKSKRYQRGNFKPLRKPKGGPQPTPTKTAKGRRITRSLSDILTLLSDEDHQALLRGIYPQHGGHGHRPTVPHAVVAPRMQQGRRPPYVHRASAGGPPPPSRMRPASGSTRPSSASTRSGTPRSLVGSFRSESRDTLKANGSMSEFSVQSGEQELEFDLYDYNLENVVAFNPGSHFAAPVAVNSIWYGGGEYDDGTTPTAGAEEFTLTELFPHSANNNPSPPDQVMLRSRTSDLTESVTSADLRTPVHLPFNPGEDVDEASSDCGESDRLLGGGKGVLSAAAAVAKRPQILNLTHIDDDIDFADDEASIIK